MLVVITVMIPLTVPKLFGYHIYAVLTESMTPAYSVGSVVYIRDCGAEDIEIGDVITFRMGTASECVMTHRVMEIDAEQRTFITKGDANNVVDPEPVQFERLIGKVVLCVPGLARVSDYIDSTTGRSVIFIMFAVAFILWVIADLLAPKKSASGIRADIREQGNAEKEESGMKEKPEKRSRGDVVRMIVRLVGVALIIAAGGYLCSVFMEYREGEAEYEALEELVFAQVTEDSKENEVITNDSANTLVQDEEVSLTEKDVQIMQAIRDLKEQNEDVIGWITIDNMEISYPIMHGDDNDYYLSHTFSGESNSAGSIFMEAANNPDFEDCHTIIYGHNMRNLSMFGTLKYYKEEEFYEEHRYFTIYTEEHVYRYEIFAYYDISEVGDIYTVGFVPGEEFQEFINKMIRRSYYDTNIEVTEQDKVITLSTCSSKGNRFVINAKRVEEK